MWFSSCLLIYFYRVRSPSGGIIISCQVCYYACLVLTPLTCNRMFLGTEYFWMGSRSRRRLSSSCMAIWYNYLTLFVSTVGVTFYLRRLREIFLSISMRTYLERKSGQTDSFWANSSNATYSQGNVNLLCATLLGKWPWLFSKSQARRGLHRDIAVSRYRFICHSSPSSGSHQTPPSCL